MSFLNPSVADARRRRLIVGGSALLITTIGMVAFALESRWGYSAPTLNVIYMQNWAGDRSRADALADARATVAAQEAKKAQSRAYIATLTGKAKLDAQKQYDAYVAGNGAQQEIPYVAAAAPVPVVAGEPPVQ
ncbi:hypothetical protein [Sandarakinorhabdus sp. DWP1-3-1]|uniref:hypothetical protein n=1 Tax=Sandarakinorhabdus sp. DWP1-3-1 TaxID=2804627 RepID=UPI003CF4B8E2